MSLTDAAVLTAVMRRLLKEQEQNGEVTNASVEAASQLTGLTTRHLRRKVKNKDVSVSKAYSLGEREVAFIYATTGNVAAAYDALVRAGELDPSVVSRSTFYRGANSLDSQILIGARKGRKGHDACNATVSRHIAHRNASWATDHKLVPNRVLFGDAVIQPWFTEILDEATRLVVAWLLTIAHPTVEDDLELLATACAGTEIVTGGGRVFVGGWPEAVNSDRGGDYVSRAATLGLVSIGIERTFTMPYSPNQNGRAEALHGFLQKRVFPMMKGFTTARYHAVNPNAAKPSTEAKDLETFESFAALHNPRCSCGLNPPASSSDLAM